MSPDHDTRRALLARWRAALAASLSMLLASFLATAPGMGASSSVTVTFDVASSVSITNGCRSAAATAFGTVQPGTPVLTATDSSICRVQFESTNDSAMLRIGQRDGIDRAMQRAGAWTSSGSASSEYVQSVAAITSLVRVAVGRMGSFHRTVDGGATWTRWQSIAGINPWLYDITPVPGDPATCYAVGTNASLVRITNCDSGTPSFTNLTSVLVASGWPSSTSARGIAVISSSTMIVVGNGGWAAKSTDTAASFGTAFQVAGASSFSAIDPLDANTIYAAGVGSTDSVFRTTTGGGTAASWTAAGAGGSTMSAIDVVDATTVYVAGAGSIVRHFDGTSWNSRTLLGWGSETLLGVAAHPTTPGTVYVAGQRGQLMRSTDSGATWSRMTTGLSEDLLDIDALSPTDVIAVGATGAATRTTTGSDWTATAATAGVSSWEDVAAHPTNGQVAIAAGSHGRIGRTIDGGATWTVVSTPSQRGLYGVTYGSGDVAWAVGEDGDVVRSTDGGVTWSAQETGSSARLWSVAAVDERRAWAVGDSGTILRTDDGGATWTAQSSGTTVSLRGVSAVDRSRAVTVGRGTVRRTGDGGATWLAASSIPNTSQALVDVSHGSEDVLVAAGVYQRIWRSTDGGDTWAVSTSGPGDQFSISAVDEYVSFVAGPWGGVTRIDSRSATTSSGTVDGVYHNRGIVGTGRESAITVGQNGVAGRMRPSTAGTSIVNDYGASPSNWAGTGSSSMFGACLQAVGAQTSAVWSTDAGGKCTASDSDPWNAVPALATKVANTTAAGATGSVDLVWGVRTASDQAKGSYSAMVVFEALAPNA